MLRTVLGVVFAGRSVERLPHSRRHLLISAAVAVAVAYLAHLLYSNLNVPQAILRIVCELGGLVIAVRLRERLRSSGTNVRYRVLKTVSGAFAISILGDATLVVISLVPVERSLSWLPWGLGSAVYLAQFVGLANCVRYGWSVKWLRALIYTAGYVLLVTVTFDALRPLFDIFSV